MNWFTSDPHYYHKNVIAYCNRPFESLDEMHHMLITNWNMFVQNNDRVFVVGDFSFGNSQQTKEVIQKLKGHKILIIGNHDKNHSKKWWIDAGFEEVVDEMRMKLGKFDVKLCHYPSGSPLRKTYESTYIQENNETLLCGHVHDRWIMKEQIINVGVDVWNFMPVADFQITQILEGWACQTNS